MPKSVSHRDGRIRFAAGEPVLTVRVALHAPSSGVEEELYEILAFESSDRPGQAPGPIQIRDDVIRYIQQELGEGFNVSRFIVGRGSIEILISIAAVVEIVANWDDMVRNVDRLLSRLRAYFSSRMFRRPLPGPIWVDADWRPDFDVGRVLLGAGRESTEIPMVVLWYLISTNLAMLGLLVWLVVARG